MSSVGVSVIGGCYLLCAFFFLVWWAGFWQLRGRERVAMVMYVLMPFAIIGPMMVVSIEAGEGNEASIDWMGLLSSDAVCFIAVPLIVLALCRAWPFGPKPWAEYRSAVKHFREQSRDVDPSLSSREGRRIVIVMAVSGLAAASCFGWFGWLMAFSPTGHTLQAESPDGGYFALGVAFVFFAVVILFFSVRELVRLWKAGPLDDSAPDLPPQESGAPWVVSVFIGIALAVKRLFSGDNLE